MVKHTATIQKLPLEEAGLRSKTEEGCGRQLFHVHSAANTHSVPFRLGFQSLSVQPAALFRPGKPGHLPPREGLGGSLQLLPFNRGHTKQRCAGGRLIASPTGYVLVSTTAANRVGQGAGWIGATPRASLKMCLSPPRKRTGWARARAGLVPPQGRH